MEMDENWTRFNGCSIVPKDSVKKFTKMWKSYCFVYVIFWLHGKEFFKALKIFLINLLRHAHREFFVPKLQYFLSFKYI